MANSAADSAPNSGGRGLIAASVRVIAEVDMAVPVTVIGRKITALASASVPLVQPPAFSRRHVGHFAADAQWH